MPPKPSPTHFLCIPLADAQLARSLASFRADVTSASSFDLPKEAVRPLGTLHLTLGVMALQKDGVKKAVELLGSLRPGDMVQEARLSRASGDGRGGGGSSSLSITIRGLHAMQPAEKASVLYAPPSDSEGILYDFCARLRKPFQDSKLMVDENRPLLLHGTVINTIYVKNNGGGGGGRGRRREKMTIDARDVLGRYEDYLWAEEMPITRVALCRMGAKKMEGADDAAYEVEAEVEF